MQHDERKHECIEQAWDRAGVVKDLQRLRFGVLCRTPARKGKERRRGFVVDAEELKRKARKWNGWRRLEGEEKATYTADAAFTLCDRIPRAIKCENAGSVVKPARQYFELTQICK